MLDVCQLKIDVSLRYGFECRQIPFILFFLPFALQQEMKENDTEEINTEVLTIVSNRINDMYNNMFLLFPVEQSSLSEYIEFCSNNVSMD